jgi:hypothetical protein
MEELIDFALTEIKKSAPHCCCNVTQDDGSATVTGDRKTVVIRPRATKADILEQLRHQYCAYHPTMGWLMVEHSLDRFVVYDYCDRGTLRQRTTHENGKPPVREYWRYNKRGAFQYRSEQGDRWNKTTETRSNEQVPPTQFKNQ